MRWQVYFSRTKQLDFDYHGKMEKADTAPTYLPVLSYILPTLGKMERYVWGQYSSYRIENTNLTVHAYTYD